MRSFCFVSDTPRTPDHQQEVRFLSNKSIFCFMFGQKSQPWTDEDSSWINDPNLLTPPHSKRKASFDIEGDESGVRPMSDVPDGEWTPQVFCACWFSEKIQIFCFLTGS